MKTMNLSRFRDLVCHMATNADERVPFEIEDKKTKKKIKLNFSAQRDMFRQLVNNYVFSSGIHINAFSPALATQLGSGQTMPNKDQQVDTSLILQAFSGTPDLPELTKNVFQRTMHMPEIDVAWQLAYQPVPLERGDLEWEIFDVDTGFTFEMVAEGAEAKIYGVSGSETKAKVELVWGWSWPYLENYRITKALCFYSTLRKITV